MQALQVLMRSLPGRGGQPGPNATVNPVWRSPREDEAAVAAPASRKNAAGEKSWLKRVAAMDRSVALRRVRGALEASDAADPPVPRGRRERGRGGPEL